METIDLVIDRLYREDEIITHPFREQFVKKMLAICSHSLFMYNSELYKQVVRADFSSPPAPSLMLLAHIECRLLLNRRTVPVNSHKFYLRYLYDMADPFYSKFSLMHKRSNASFLWISKM